MHYRPRRYAHPGAAEIFVAQGTADRAVAPETLDFLRAELRSRGRDAEFHQVEGADHNFVIDRANQRNDAWADVINEVVSGFLAARA